MEIGTILTFVGLGVVGLIGIIALFSTFFVVQQNTLAAVERFGKFKRVAGAGLNIKIPFIDSASRRLTLRIQQLDVPVETITKDKVTVKVVTSIQYMVLEARAQDAFYKLQDPHAQITAYVFDQVRAVVPDIDLDEVFTNKDKIAIAVKDELADSMDDFGYMVVKALVTDIDPEPKVKAAMNEINEAKRNRVAAEERGEADKILQVKKAEAEAESKKLQGKGIADQRMAIVEGLQQSVTEFQKAVEGSTANDVMQLVLMTQYFDAMKDMAATGQVKVVFMPSSPGGLSDISDQIRNAIMTGGEVTSADSPAAE